MQKCVKISLGNKKKFMKTVKFHKKRWNCTQTVKFTQKISEFTKITVIIILTLISFTQLSKNASAYVCGLNKKPDYLYFFQKLERKVKKSSQFCVVIFQFHVLQQMER